MYAGPLHASCGGQRVVARVGPLYEYKRVGNESRTGGWHPTRSVAIEAGLNDSAIEAAMLILQDGANIERMDAAIDPSVVNDLSLLND